MPRRQLTKAGARKEVRRIFETVIVEIGKVRGSATKERAVWARAAKALVAVQRATGNEGDYARMYIGHMLGAEGYGSIPAPMLALDPSDIESKRWFAAIDAAAAKA